MINLDKLFPTKNDKEKALAYLNQLQKTEGWKILVELLNEDIAKMDDDLRVKQFENVNEVNEIQNKRAYLVILKQLPEKLTDALKEDPLKEPDFEIY